MGDFSCEIKGHAVEFFEDGHTYLVDGVIVPSITQILGVKFGKKYAGISRAVLNKAAAAGTAVHEAIEDFCQTGFKAPYPEVRNFIFLQKHYGFEVLENEVPVILFLDDEPFAAGRLDLVLQMDGKVGGADIKRTSTLDKEYLAYQLNLYRIAYRQCYGTEWEFLRGIHLRGETRKFVSIPIHEDLALGLAYEYKERKEGKHEQSDADRETDEGRAAEGGEHQCGEVHAGGEPEDEGRSGLPAVCGVREDSGDDREVCEEGSSPGCERPA